MKRPCLEPGCPELTTGSRCPAHTRAKQRARDATRGTPAQRGYGWQYQQNRARVLAMSDGLCGWSCGRAATTADHVIPLSRGGTNDLENLMPSCAPCNSSRGSRPAPSAWVRRGAVPFS